MDKTHITIDKIFKVYNDDDCGVTALIEFFNGIDNEIVFEGEFIPVQQKIYNACIKENKKQVNDLIFWINTYMVTQLGRQSKI